MRDAAINLRALPEQRDLIDCAAKLLGKNRSDFMLEAACSAAQAVVLDPVPVMVLGRLAVDHRAQGIELGVSPLQDAVNLAVVVSQNAGVRALLVHALHDRAKAFYEHYGFQSSPLHPMTLMLNLNGGVR